MILQSSLRNITNSAIIILLEPPPLSMSNLKKKRTDQDTVPVLIIELVLTLNKNLGFKPGVKHEPQVRKVNFATTEPWSTL